MSGRPEAIVTGTAEQHELERIFEVDAGGFGQRMPDAVIEALAKTAEPSRITVSRDVDGGIVGTAVTAPTRMTLPGGTRPPTAAVVGVSVLPTHRRQGRLSAMMRHQLDELHRRGDPLATLYASEATIYGRYGYAPATFGARYRIDRLTAGLARPISDFAPGSVRMIGTDEARGVFPALWADYAPTRAGEVDALPAEWLDVEGVESPDEARQRFFAVYSEGDRVDGAVSYRVAPVDTAEPWPQRGVFLERFVVTSRAAYVALWGFLLGIDLVKEIRTLGRPMDEPIRWLLTDHRHLRVIGHGDRSWIRLVDVARCLSSRRYGAEGTLVLEVEDPFCEWNSGIYRLEAGPTVESWGPEPDPVRESARMSAVCLTESPARSPGAGGRVASSAHAIHPSGGVMSAPVDPDSVSAHAERVSPLSSRRALQSLAVDVSLDVMALAAIFLGGVSLSTLAAAGRVTPRSSESLALAERFFATCQAPFCSLHF